MYGQRGRERRGRKWLVGKKIDWHQMGGAGSLSELVNQTVIGRNSHTILNIKISLNLLGVLYAKEFSFYVMLYTIVLSNMS